MGTTEKKFSATFGHRQAKLSRSVRHLCTVPRTVAIPGCSSNPHLPSPRVQQQTGPATYPVIGVDDLREAAVFRLLLVLLLAGGVRPARLVLQLTLRTARAGQVSDSNDRTEIFSSL